MVKVGSGAGGRTIVPAEDVSSGCSGGRFILHFVYRKFCETHDNEYRETKGFA